MDREPYQVELYEHGGKLYGVVCNKGDAIFFMVAEINEKQGNKSFLLDAKSILQYPNRILRMGYPYIPYEDSGTTDIDFVLMKGTFYALVDVRYGRETPYIYIKDRANYEPRIPQYIAEYIGLPTNGSDLRVSYP